MQLDTEGFVYPVIDDRKCIQCDRCRKVCPVNNKKNVRRPFHVYAVKNRNEEIRAASSSGGMFTLFAEKVIHDGGVVFGARFNDKWEIVHDYTEIIAGLASFRGSKYVQSIIGDAYKQARTFLLKGRKVLFSGTPCQIAGLKEYLQEDFENLITIDLVCHGVPGPEVWQRYLEELINAIAPPHPDNYYMINERFYITSISFRHKIYGWKELTLVIQIGYIEDMLKNKLLDIQHRDKKFYWKQSCGTTKYFINKNKDIQKTITITKPLSQNAFMKGFLNNIYLRPSCYQCPTRCLRSGSDITLGDYWGIQNTVPEFDDDKGVSLVMINSQKGNLLYEQLEKEDRETTYTDACAGNPTIEKSEDEPLDRAVFFKRWQNEKIIPLINELTYISLCIRIRNKIISILSRVLRKIGLYSMVKSIVKG
jgi:coenzyme F420-reducing hydrogenase beta subunit